MYIFSIVLYTFLFVFSVYVSFVLAMTVEPPHAFSGEWFEDVRFERRVKALARQSRRWVRHRCNKLVSNLRRPMLRPSHETA